MLTVHHLDYSRSTRVLWLLEELGLDYELVRYRRAVGGPAPDPLKAVHPLGKSPVIVDGDFVLAESSAILRYIDARHGDGRFTPGAVEDRARHDEWLDYVEGGLALPLFVPLVAGPELPERMRTNLAGQLSNGWDHIERTLMDREYLLGEGLTLADIQMVYVLAVASATGSLDSRPKVEAYLQRLLLRPALQRAIAAGGPMG